jgi:hypothetical protein
VYQRYTSEKNKHIMISGKLTSVPTYILLQILINAKFPIGKRGQNTELTGRTPLRR